MAHPFYRQIVTALETKDFDPRNFERCMSDVLRDPFPGLAPIPGGSDAGMDGAIADGQGEPYPLICTTAERVSRNLTRSLESYLAHGGKRRQVVLATSIALTPQGRRKLEQRAREKGFALFQIFDRRAVADRLYYSQRWCRELLGLAWRPQALSPVPRPGRPQLEIDLIGRDADVEWLRATAGDRLITGQPGSGKTFLLRHLARDGWGVFLHSDERGEIRSALCEQRPEVVIVDDAHEDLRRLKELRHLRQELEYDFAIVATCWESERDGVAEALESLPVNRIRRLELLTRDQILEVIRQTGVQASDEFLRLLVNQAANKPGLAVTLATFCLRGSWLEVLQGDALARSLMTDFKKLIGRESADFLAVLGVGGNRGMPIEAAGDFLGIGLQRARELAIRLSMDGVISEAEDRLLAVWPEALRSALLRQAFFEGPARLHYQPLLERAPNFESAVAALVTAARYGANIPEQELRSLVERCRVPDGWQSRLGHTHRAWQLYTALGERESRWALDHYSGNLMDIAEEALVHAPRVAVPRLLEEAAGEEAASRPFDLLRGWMQDLSAEERIPGELIERRRLAVQLAKRYREGGGERQVATWVLLTALSPRIESTGRDPGMGQTVTIRQGLLPVEQLRQLETIWMEGCETIEKIETETWSLLKQATWFWIHPASAAPTTAIQPSIPDTLQGLARRVLGDLSPLAEGSPGLSSGLVRIAKRMSFALQLPTDPVFDLLYPDDASAPERREPEPPETVALQELARRWVTARRPEAVVQDLIWYEGEASRIGHQWPRRMPNLCRVLAQNAENASRWVETGLDQGLPADLVRPFLEKVVESRSDGWQNLLTRCFDLDLLRWEAARMVLQLQDPPPQLLEVALATAAAFPQLVDMLCLRREVPLSTLAALLTHPDPHVALAAAVGEWNADPQGQVTDEIEASWRLAVLRSVQIDDKRILDSSGGLGYWLGEILRCDPGLARDWLSSLLQSAPELATDIGGTVRVAIDALQVAHRVEILEELQPGPFAYWELPRLVDRKEILYRRLLDLEHLKDHHLRPLVGRPDEDWARLAKLALAAGYEPDAIARVCYSGTPEGPGIAGGQDQSYWARWDRSFAEMEEDPDAELREVARRGRGIAREETQRAATRQREREREGL